jgi:Rieske Fe-S protein
MSTRRTFCAQASWVLAAGVFGPRATFAQGSAAPLPTIRGEVVEGRVKVAIGGTPLVTVGGVARVVSSAGSFLATRTGETTCAVLSAICSHESCLVTDGDADAFVCPCHQSRFDRQGRVLTPPAELPLAACQATFEGSTLTITVP